MSTIVAQTISNGSVSTSSANVIQGCSKAWVNFNGTGTVAIRASYNVSSITDNGAGNYTVNFTNALPDANYSVVGTGSTDGTYGSWSLSPFSNGTTVVAPTTTAVRVTMFVAAIGAVDSPYVSIAVFD
jgi:hypothetical protein